MSAESREFYERQGAEAIADGRELDCSEQTTNDVVLAMAMDRSPEFHSILDVGCGANLTYDIALAAEQKTVWGVDFTLNFLRMAPRHPRLTLAQANAAALPFRSETFDAAICSETVEHIEDDRAVVAEIARVLKPDGLLFFTVPNLWNASRLIEMVRTRAFAVRLMEGHIREYSTSQAARLLSPWFDVQHHHPVGFGWTGKFGGKIERLVRLGILRGLSKSVAFTAHKRGTTAR